MHNSRQIFELQDTTYYEELPPDGIVQYAETLGTIRELVKSRKDI